MGVERGVVIARRNENGENSFKGKVNHDFAGERALGGAHIAESLGRGGGCARAHTHTHTHTHTLVLGFGYKKYRWDWWYMPLKCRLDALNL